MPRGVHPKKKETVTWLQNWRSNKTNTRCFSSFFSFAYKLWNSLYLVTHTLFFLLCIFLILFSLCKETSISFSLLRCAQRTHTLTGRTLVRCFITLEKNTLDGINTQRKIGFTRGNASYTYLELDGDEHLNLRWWFMVSMNRLGIRGTVVVVDVIDVVVVACVDTIGTQNRNPNTKAS